MNSMIRSPRIVAALVAVIAGLALALLLLNKNAGVASADPVFSGGLKSSVSPGSDTALLGLKKANPALDVAGARLVLADSAGSLWLTSSSNGDVCVLEKINKPDTQDAVSSRFVCKAPAEAAVEGVIGGVPGHWFGVVPDGVDTVYSGQDGRSTPVKVTTNAFRLPAEATSVTVPGAAPAPLVTAAP